MPVAKAATKTTAKSKKAYDYERIGKEKVLNDLKRDIANKAPGINSHSGQQLINTLENLVEEATEAIKLLKELKEK